MKMCKLDKDGLCTARISDYPNANYDSFRKCMGYARCDRYKNDNMKPTMEVWEAHGASVVVDADQDSETILEEAQRITHGDRNDDYGHPLDDFSKTAAMWTPIVGATVTPEMVALMMVCLKISRELNRPTRDNKVDICGYAHNLEMIEQERKRRSV